MAGVGSVPVAGLGLVAMARAGSPMMTRTGLVPTSAEVGSVTMARLRQAQCQWPEQE